jgi:hypothetical protein
MLCVAKSRTPGHLGHQWVLDFDGNHGLKVRETSQSQSQPSQTLSSRETEIETEALTAILHEHAGKDLSFIYEHYVKGTFPLSRATYYRRAQSIRTRVIASEVSPE